ncbi:MAG: DUF2461 domain-containing protein [Bacteroidota bacterium]
MSYFTSDFIAFFEELKDHNHKEWFDANRKRYEQSVKKPFAAFVDEMIGRINHHDPEVRIEAKDAVMRINRDIRFSADKTPYNLHVGAIISKTGRKDKSVPGIFFKLTLEGIEIYGGAHGIDKDQINKVRTAIAAEPNQFQALIEAPNFVKKFGEIHGEKNKRLPKEFEEIANDQPLIANKSFYYFTSIDKKHILSDDLADIIMEYWLAAQPIKDFLANALK